MQIIRKLGDIRIRLDSANPENSRGCEVVKRMRPMPSSAATAWIRTARSTVPPVVHRAAIGVDVLAKQVDFAHALIGKTRHFGDHIIERTKLISSPRVYGTDAKRTIFRAAFHDRDEDGHAVLARFGQVIEFFDLRKRNVPLVRVGVERRMSIICGKRCSVCGPNTEIHVGRALDDFRRLPGWRRSRRLRSRDSDWPFSNPSSDQAG